MVFSMEFIVFFIVLFFLFKQKTAYEMRISDWSSDVCSSDLQRIETESGRDDQAAASELGGYRQQHERRRRQHGSECAPALGLGIEAEKELRQAVHDEGPAGPPRIAAAAVIGDEGRVDDAPGDDPLADDPGRIEQYQGDKKAKGMRR